MLGYAARRVATPLPQGCMGMRLGLVIQSTHELALTLKRRRFTFGFARSMPTAYRKFVRWGGLPTSNPYRDSDFSVAMSTEHKSLSGRHNRN